VHNNVVLSAISYSSAWKSPYYYYYYIIIITVITSAVVVAAAAAAVVVESNLIMVAFAGIIVIPLRYATGVT
jgi:hypothetical protein